MATATGLHHDGGVSAITRERRFFLIMALAIAVTVATGFGTNLYLGRAVISELPWQVHVHAGVFSAWIALFVVQNALVVRGRLALHRALGVFGALLAAAMVVLGVTATVMAIARGATPPFFPPGIFLMIDVLGVIGFGALVAAAIVMRNRTAWHKRLMLCGTVLVMSPALGRLLPMPLLGPYAPLAVYGSMMLYVLAGMAYDLVTRRRVHPAYWVGAGVLTLVQILVGPLASSDTVLAFVEGLAV